MTDYSIVRDYWGRLARMCQPMAGRCGLRRAGKPPLTPSRTPESQHYPAGWTIKAAWLTGPQLWR